MYLTIDINKFDQKYIFFGENTINNIIKDSYFSRINYSNDNFTMNGIFIYFYLHHVNYESNISWNHKVKCHFNYEKNQYVIKNLVKIEENILTAFQSHKTPVFTIEQQLKNNFIKIFNNYNSTSSHFIFKISGIWSNDYSYGISYKFMNTPNSNFLF
uniref:Uncharacterized protein n=1 Tax=viral metagenome TaxID=1070528 RepID=A0A6C0KG64_9ZZZZ